MYHSEGKFAPLYKFLSTSFFPSIFGVGGFQDCLHQIISIPVTMSGLVILHTRWESPLNCATSKLITTYLVAPILGEAVFAPTAHITTVTSVQASVKYGKIDAYKSLLEEMSVVFLVDKHR